MPPQELLPPTPEPLPPTPEPTPELTPELTPPTPEPTHEPLPPTLEPLPIRLTIRRINGNFVTDGQVPVRRGARERVPNKRYA